MVTKVIVALMMFVCAGVSATSGGDLLLIDAKKINQALQNGQELFLGDTGKKMIVETSMREIGGGRSRKWVYIYFEGERGTQVPHIEANENAIGAVSANIVSKDGYFNVNLKISGNKIYLSSEYDRSKKAIEELYKPNEGSLAP